MSIASVDDIVAGLAASKVANFQKVLGAAKGAGAYQSAWTAAGLPGVGATPPVFTAGSGYGQSSATSGAIKMSPAAFQHWLAKLSACSSLVGTLILIDRLWSCSGMGFAAGTYNIVTPGDLPDRVTNNGEGCELWIEQFVAAGAASGTLTANYLDANSGAARTGVISSVVSAPVKGQMQWVPLEEGSNGIRQLTSITTSATWTSGSFGATIARRLAEIPIGSPNTGQVYDWAQLGLPKIGSDACLSMIWLASATTAATIIGSISIIDK